MTSDNKNDKKTKTRRGRLVIVESPAKARTVGRFLGKDFTVRASVGHVRDLLRSRLSVDIEHDFAPTYRVPNEKRDVVKELTQEVASADEIYLATDPDREGEAIAWHLMEATKMEPERVRRVVFHEITEEAIRESFAHPRSINMDLVDAQQARRVLDRLVGYQITPLLWERVRGRLSAGRVQSVAVRLIVEREREIQAFVPEEYWTIDAELTPPEADGRKAQSFLARLVKINGEKAELHNKDEVDPHLEVLQRAEYVVEEVKRGVRRRRPSPPFTTSTMQQDASRSLGFTARKTMSVAQELYEGVDIGEGGTVGLITYMRTDSVNIAAQAVEEARGFIKQTFGGDYLPKEPRIYKTRSKGAQEAHEAIRPTSVLRTPEAMQPYLNRDQYRLYNLIWQRFVACQMADAVYDTIRVEIGAGLPGEKRTYVFRASGSILKFPGFLAVYQEARDEDMATEEDEGRILPDMNQSDLLRLLRLLPEQHFTQPPPRYTEASLVKTLEEYGIGRPSTYAPIISTIQQRGYVTREDKRLTPTETGFVVNDLLVKYFPNILDVAFTASMEAFLDQIAAGEREWVPVLREFYGPFEKQLQQAQATMPTVRTEEEVGRACPVCGKPLIVRWGRYGKFIGCSGYPECRHTEPWLEKIGVKCPQCGEGEIVERKTRKRRIFYGCSRYPECDFTSWKRPLPQPCPNCGGLLVEQNKQVALCTVCEEQTPLASLSGSEPVMEEQSERV